MKRIILVLTMAACAYGGHDGVLLTDFATRKLSWTTVNDNVMGGLSEGGFEVEKGMLVFRGSTITDGGGFSSIRSSPQKLSLEGLAGFHLRVRGDGRTYTFRLSTAASSTAYWASFDTTRGRWAEVRLPFDSFVPRWRGRRLDLPPPDPAEVVGLGLMIYDKRDGPFRLEVDWIRGYAPYSLEPLKGKKRPLLVFASRADDLRLAKQLERVEAAKAGFDERHMELVVVAPGHALSGSERMTLRQRLEAGGRDFAVLLIGKDGSVKRRAEAPVPMAELFELIDGMPTRQREMKE